MSQQDGENNLIKLQIATVERPAIEPRLNTLLNYHNHNDIFPVCSDIHTVQVPGARSLAALHQLQFSDRSMGLWWNSSGALYAATAVPGVL